MARNPISEAQTNMAPSQLFTPSLKGLIASLILTPLGMPEGKADPWSIERISNPDGPGTWLQIQANQNPVAAWAFGKGQFKPYLHVFGPGGIRLTNSGLDQAGRKSGTFGHHRGIFIGWNRIQSELGTRDLWHMTKGTRMERSKRLPNSPQPAVMRSRKRPSAGGRVYRTIPPMTSSSMRDAESPFPYLEPGSCRSIFIPA